MCYNGWTPTTPELTRIANRIETASEKLKADPGNDYWNAVLRANVDRWMELNIKPYADEPATIAEAIAWAYGEPVDGSDNTMQGQLRDAGFGDGGVM